MPGSTRLKATTSTAAASLRVSRLDLKTLDPCDGALELMYFGLRGLTREADEKLARYGLSRAHHRILFVIARRDGVTVGELQANLGISAQAMHRPLKQLLDDALVAVSRNPARHRFKSLHLTTQGRRVEHEASESERRVMRDAFDRAGARGRAAWESVMNIVARSA